MLVKLLPEDFVVEELTDWQPSDRGAISVYELTKRKLDTFEAMRIVSAQARVPLQAIAYVGLKDRQGVTTQLISIDGGRLDGRMPGIHYKYLGRSQTPLSPANLLGNAFTIVVRDLGPEEVARLPDRRARIARHGIIDYFDDQRFGSLAAGQGLPGRDLVRGDHEAVVRAMIATPGKRDPIGEKKFKVLITKAWGDWDLISRKWGHRKGVAIVQHLRRKPGDYSGALQKLPAKERAIHVFAYQSWIWNRSVGLYLEKKLPAKKLARTRYVGGDLVWPDYGPDEEMPPLVESFPLLDHQVEPSDPEVREAVDAALAEEGLTRATFKIDGIRGCFFKHHERPLLVRPEDLVVHSAEEDDRRPGRLKVKLSFSLPPGAYATLVLLRLFGTTGREADPRTQREQTRRREKKQEKQRDRREERGDGRSEPPRRAAPAPAGGHAPDRRPDRGRDRAPDRGATSAPGRGPARGPKRKPKPKRDRRRS